MDGLLYLWLMWAGWIIGTFLLSKKSPWRLRVSATTLILIVSFPYGIDFFDFQAGTAAVLVFIISLLFAKEFSLAEKLYLFICSLIIAASYSSFILLSFYDPVILVVDKKIMVTVILLTLSYLLYSGKKAFKKRILAVIAGMVLGEFMSGTVFLQTGLPYLIGGHLFLDVLSIIVVSGGVLHLLQSIYVSQSHLIKSAYRKGEVKNI
ncbi:YphA family membrane protein [Bacillus sp. AK031]